MLRCNSFCGLLKFEFCLFDFLKNATKKEKMIKKRKNIIHGQPSGLSRQGGDCEVKNERSNTTFTAKPEAVCLRWFLF
jgi:hypothetical protein